MPQRGTTQVYSSINSSAGNLPGCLHFHYNRLSSDSRGCFETGSMVTDSTMQLLSDVLGSIWGAVQDALVLAYLLQTASVKGKKRPLLFCSSVWRYSCACGTNTENPSTEHMKYQKSRPTAQPVLFVSHKGDTLLENWWHVPSLFLVSRRWQLCAIKEGLGKKLKQSQYWGGRGQSGIINQQKNHKTFAFFDWQQDKICAPPVTFLINISAAAWNHSTCICSRMITLQSPD